MSLHSRVNIGGLTHVSGYSEGNNCKKQTERPFVTVQGVPALRPELQIFRLPGEGGYSTRPLGTTNSLQNLGWKLTLHPSHHVNFSAKC